MKVNRICILGLLCLFLVGSGSAFAQKKDKKSSDKGSEIKFVFKGLPDTMLYIATYYEDKNFMYDTLYVSKKEPYTFIMKKDTLVPRGIYLMAGQNKVKYMDFVIDSVFSFTAVAENINSEAIDIISNLRFGDSPENTVMQTFFITMSRLQRNLYEVVGKIKEEEASENPNATLIGQLQENRKQYQDSMRTFMTDYVDLHRNSLFGRAQLLMRDIEVPEPPRNSDGSLVDSNFGYQYYLNHYWDNTDFSEPALLGTPVWYSKIETYFNDVVPPLVDSINKYADLLIKRAENTPELFKYIVWYVTNKYERSQYVAHDAVFVHMVQNYYAKGRCTWTDEAVLERMVNQAEKLSHILIGTKAPELSMYDTNGIFRSNYESNRKYTIMWFWDLNCGHCKSATPKLVDFYNRMHDSLDFEVFAVCMTKDSTDLPKWKERIREKEMPWINVGGNTATVDYRIAFDVTTTPVIFVLDKEKRIIVKKIGIDQLEDFLRNYDSGIIKY